MSHTPLILICGQAGSGKDTVASFMVKNHGAIAIAQADPMKRLAKMLFGFTDEQLWGPSECRNAADERFDPAEEALARAEKIVNLRAATPWDQVWENIRKYDTVQWLNDLFDGAEVTSANEALKNWLNGVMTQTYYKSKPLTPRYVLQTLGTEWGRAQGRDLWSNYTIKTAFKLLGGGFGYSRDKGLYVDLLIREPSWVVITDGRFRNEIVNVLKAGGTTVKVFNPGGTDNRAIEAAGVKGHASEKELGGIPGHFYTATFRNDKTKGLRCAEASTTDFMKYLEGRQYSAGEFGA